MGASDSSIPLHFVYAKKSRGCGTEVHCDCPVYSSTPKVCHHSLAAADDISILSDYLTFLQKTKDVALNPSTLISNELMDIAVAFTLTSLFNHQYEQLLFSITNAILFLTCS